MYPTMHLLKKSYIIMLCIDLGRTTEHLLLFNKLKLNFWFKD